MLKQVLRGGMLAATLFGAGMLAAACSATAEQPAPGTPYSLGGKSVVAGFTPTPTAAISTPAKAESHGGGEAKLTEAPSGGGSPPRSGGQEISTVGNTLVFDKLSLTVGNGQVTVTFHNKATSASLQHNWVLVKRGTIDEVAGQGLSAGPGRGWIPTADTNVIAHTKLVDGGKSDTVTFAAPPAGTYSFLCSFPGHSGSMQGDFVVQ